MMHIIVTTLDKRKRLIPLKAIEFIEYDPNCNQTAEDYYTQIDTGSYQHHVSERPEIIMALIDQAEYREFIRLRKMHHAANLQARKEVFGTKEKG